MTTTNTSELLRQIGHMISYRQLDYWDRHGTIRLTGDHGPWLPNGAHLGSGARRNPTDAEMAALIDTIERHYSLIAQMDDLRSGEYFMRRLAHHQAAEEQEADR